MRKADAAVVPGGWLLTAHCECGDWIVIDTSAGPTSAVTLPAKLHLVCDSCGRTASYGLSDVRHSRVSNRAIPTAPQPAPERRAAAAPIPAKAAEPAAHPVA